MGASKGHFVTRRTKGKKDLSILEAPKAQLDYAKQFNAVDKNDRDSSDFTTSISMRTNCWYLRVFFWIFDRVIHLVYKSTQQLGVTILVLELKSTKNIRTSMTVGRSFKLILAFPYYFVCITLGMQGKVHSL